MTPADSAAALAGWYQKHGRPLPWRQTRDPYQIWVSEIMLQQTQVETVKPYYARFLARWPTIADLAAASSDEVMKAWEGLGYYARCRNLQRAAGIIVADHGGVFPDTMEAVQALPGIGRSTAGAILTFGHGQRWPLLDANVKRVLTRLFDVDIEPSRAVAQRALWEHSQSLLDGAEDPWTHNQAMMELGASVCTPRSPGCDTCPVAAMCQSRVAGTQLLRPVKKKKKPIPHKQIGVGVIYDAADRILIQLRPPEGLLGGLWEFPGGKQEPGEDIQQTVVRELAEELSIEVAVGPLIKRVRHRYSHFEITLHAYACRHVSGTPQPLSATEFRWVPLDGLSRFAFPKANKVVLETMLANALDSAA